MRIAGMARRVRALAPRGTSILDTSVAVNGPRDVPGRCRIKRAGIGVATPDIRRFDRPGDVAPAEGSGRRSGPGTVRASIVLIGRRAGAGPAAARRERR